MVGRADGPCGSPGQVELDSRAERCPLARASVARFARPRAPAVFARSGSAAFSTGRAAPPCASCVGERNGRIAAMGARPRPGVVSRGAGGSGPRYVVETRRTRWRGRLPRCVRPIPLARGARTAQPSRRCHRPHVPAGCPPVNDEGERLGCSGTASETGTGFANLEPHVFQCSSCSRASTVLYPLRTRLQGVDPTGGSLRDVRILEHLEHWNNDVWSDSIRVPDWEDVPEQGGTAGGDVAGFRTGCRRP
jgi:hypothetical protein